MWTTRTWPQLTYQRHVAGLSLEIAPFLRSFRYCKVRSLGSIIRAAAARDVSARLGGLVSSKSLSSSSGGAVARGLPVKVPR